MAKEYIERETALKLLDRNSITKHITFADDVSIYDTIKNIPAADVIEVVRCRDCKHFTKGMAIGMCKRIKSKPIIPIPYNHFCSFGERRK